MVIWKKIALVLVSLCLVASCESTFQKPLDPFTLLRYDKRTVEDQPPPPQPPTKEKATSIEFDEYPVSLDDEYNCERVRRRTIGSY